VADRAARGRIDRVSASGPLTMSVGELLLATVEHDIDVVDRRRRAGLDVDPQHVNTM
jgi:hypothetical protein